jgi:hypothetical protein
VAASARRFESGGQLAGKEFLEPFFRVAGDVSLLTRFDRHPQDSCDQSSEMLQTAIGAGAVELFPADIP